MHIEKENLSITRIPFPSKILAGDWFGMVYAIVTESSSREEHDVEVQKAIADIIDDFDGNNHYSVSLREVKRQLVFEDERTQNYCTLAEFRVRDSY